MIAGAFASAVVVIFAEGCKSWWNVAMAWTSCGVTVRDCIFFNPCGGDHHLPGKSSRNRRRYQFSRARYNGVFGQADFRNG